MVWQISSLLVLLIQNNYMYNLGFNDWCVDTASFMLLICHLLEIHKILASLYFIIYHIFQY